MSGMEVASHQKQPRIVSPGKIGPQEDAMRDVRFGDSASAHSPLSQEMVEKYFYCRLAIVQMKPRESTEEAWDRHLAAYPGDVYATIKVFNRPAISIS
jgi:hypothetical protein